MSPTTNEVTRANAGGAGRSQIRTRWAARIAQFIRSPIMRAERAKLKSCKDDEIIAQGKRSAALGYGRKVISSFFPSGFARLWRAKPEGKKEVGWVGSLPRAAASAALPWAIILLPLRGAGKANQRAGGDGGMSPRFRAGRLWPAAPQHRCWAAWPVPFALTKPA